MQRDQTGSPTSGERLTAALPLPLRIPFSCQRGGSGLRPLSALVGALRPSGFSSPPSDSPHAILITGPGVRSFSGHLRQAPPASGLHVVTDTATSRGKEKLVSKKAHSEKEPANHQDQQVPFVIMQLCPIPQAVIALLQLGEPISVLEIGNDVSIPQAVIALLQPRCMFVKYTSSGCFNTASGNSPVATLCPAAQQWCGLKWGF